LISETRQGSYYGGRLVLSRLQNPDFLMLVQSFGAWTRRVEDPNELLPGIREAMAAGRPALIEVRSEDLEAESPLLQSWWEYGEQLIPIAGRGPVTLPPRR